MKTVEALGYTIFTDQPEKISLDKRTIIHTINPYSYCMAADDPFFKHALKSADILLPDGIGISKGVKLLTGEKVQRITGSDIHDFLLQKMDKENGRCFYLGSSEKTLELIKVKLKKQFPNVIVGLYSPPYKAVFSEHETNEMIKAVNNFEPDVLFVGMTAPKQEKWVEENKYKLHVKTISTVGAVFDYYSGNIKRASPFLIKLGLEWFVRLISEPKRLWKRYLYYGPKFCFEVFKLKLGFTKSLSQESYS